MKTKKKSRPRKPGQERKSRTRFPAGYKARKSRGIIWWKPEAKGESVGGTVKKFHISNLTGNKSPILKDQPGEPLIGLPDHAILLDLLDEVAIGDDVIIVCVAVGSRRKGDTYDYEVGVRPSGDTAE